MLSKYSNCTRLPKIKTNLNLVAFTNKVGKNSPYFVGVFNKTVIPLALVGHEMIIANWRYAPRSLSTISYPKRTCGIIVKYHIAKPFSLCDWSICDPRLTGPNWTDWNLNKKASNFHVLLRLQTRLSRLEDWNSLLTISINFRLLCAKHQVLVAYLFLFRGNKTWYCFFGSLIVKYRSAIFARRFAQWRKVGPEFLKYDAWFHCITC